MAKKQVRIALLGFGTVGSGIYRIVTGMRDEIARREDIELSVARVLVKAPTNPTRKSLRTSPFSRRISRTCSPTKRFR